MTSADRPPLIVVDPDDPLPPSEQIRVQVARQIAAGRLAPGAPLPSVRQLARDLGVAANTVVRAYGQLAGEGWVVARARRGFAVADAHPPLTSEDRARQLAEAVGQLLVTAHQLGARPGELIDEIRRQVAGRRARQS